MYLERRDLPGRRLFSQPMLYHVPDVLRRGAIVQPQTAREVLYRQLRVIRYKQDRDLGGQAELTQAQIAIAHRRERIVRTATPATFCSHQNLLRTVPLRECVATARAA